MEINETILDFLEDEHLESMEGLDLACGTGTMTFVLAGRMKKVTGIDISKEAIETAKRIAMEKGVKNVEFYVDDAYKIESGKFGEISLISSRFFMSKGIVRAAGRTLKKGGIFVFACFHEDNLKEFWRSDHGFSTREIIEYLQKNGFEVKNLEVLKETTDYKSREELVEDFPFARDHWKKEKWSALMDFFDSKGRRLTYSNMVGKAVKL